MCANVPEGGKVKKTVGEAHMCSGGALKTFPPQPLKLSLQAGKRTNRARQRLL